MKRRIILFSVSFLLSIGVLGALYGLLRSTDDSKEESGKDAAKQEQKVAQDKEKAAAEAAKKAEEEKKAEAERKAAEEESARKAAEEEAAKKAAEEAAAEQNKQAEQKAKQPATPEEMEQQLLSDLQDALKSEDYKAAIAQLVADGKVEEAAGQALVAWREKFQPGEMEHVGTIRTSAKENDLSRWRLKPAAGDEDILLDVRVGDKSARLEAATPTSSDKTKLSATSDAMTSAEAFVESVRQMDMWKARGLVTGEDVSDATLAGLCMIFEDSNYVLPKRSPIRNTFSNDEHAGYIVYLVPRDGKGQKGNFGLELTKEGESWKIAGVSFESLLAVYEARAEAEDGVYFPIVKNPKGGDSLALYFGFDQATLSERSERQLKIVAEILIKSGGKLDISGHTDDIGTDVYNLELSKRRAEAVKAALVQFGVPEDQITTAGMGRNQPRRLPEHARTDREAKTIRDENRRAEIYLDFENPNAQ